MDKETDTELQPDPNAPPASNADGSSAQSPEDASTNPNPAAAGAELSTTSGAPSSPPLETSAGDTTSAPALAGANPAPDTDAAVAAITPKNALAGTSGVTNGNNQTGMAAGLNTVKAPSTQPANDPTQPGLPGIPADTSNVNVPAIGAPHPIAHKANSLIIEVRQIVANIEKSPAILRAEKLLQEAQEWIVQHFEDVKRKGL